MQLPDFDELLKLAESQPEALEALRQQHIQALLDESSPKLRRRLQGLQFQIDGLRRSQQHPLGACIKISNLMNESVHSLLLQINDLADDAPRLNAVVLPFKPRT
ncbi:DUF3135 domain-containing protein [Simiduia sp. 21SJ11W-1]|uniref:DUF3135 domain-containing protein n=1 Tax=Simiduia sp. 21SJ11W-1 TaxID=2909669 RepID=UPI0020A12E7E|nr:DUF3135 domain-containing protein [Simiduia sp. 21SJ11W-1]UTA46320.1 DUF3135 domain-containing protein [Simiduia sp. 21SJ11W-1]